MTPPGLREAADQLRLTQTVQWRGRRYCWHNDGAAALPVRLQLTALHGLGRAQPPLLLRDMERVYSLCNHKGRCDRDLADGTAAETFHGYCGDAQTLESLERADVAPH